MLNRVSACGVILYLSTSSAAHAQVSASSSHVWSDTNIYLTAENGKDESVVIDEQGAEINGLSTIAGASFSNLNGSFFGSTIASASFTDQSSGSYQASTSFFGIDSGHPDAMGSYGHTLASEFEYQFFFDGEGSIEIDSTLFNSSTVFESFVRITMSSEFVLGGGFAGNYYDESILDTENVGTLDFDRTIPLNAPSGSYRLRLLISTSGLGLRDQPEVSSSLQSAFVIHEDSSCPADLNSDGALNFFDVSDFLSAFGMMDPSADFNGDGSLNFFDVSAFLAAFGDGCP